MFDEDRYFDVFVEYAKQTPTDILIQISLCNRGAGAAVAHVLPTLWYRNIWTWWPGIPKPSLLAVSTKSGVSGIAAADAELGEYFLYCEGKPQLLFTENETNNQRCFGSSNLASYVKDGINDFVVAGRQEAINPQQAGTKASAHYQVEVGPGQTAIVRLRLTNISPDSIGDPFGCSFPQILTQRQGEADMFYRAVTPPGVSEDAANVMRQALAGMLWSMQCYFFDVDKWLEERGAEPMHPEHRQVRNAEWQHMVSHDVISMPDKWEYPWFAAWDLGFHAIALSTVDVDFAKRQLDLLLQGFYLHPTGQVPAYEWNFSDVNPPVHAWATIFLHRMEQALGREPDMAFLARAFNKLSLNFTWWTNRKDRFGRNLYEGGFLGLDNIGVFDRSAPLPTRGYLEQADGTAWMALFSQNMLEIGIELAARDPACDDLATKFAEQFLWIGRAMNGAGPDGMWDEADGFYYDVLRLPDGRATRLKVRSMVGLLPICAITVVEPWQRDCVPQLLRTFMERLRRMPDLLDSIHPTGPAHQGVGQRGIMGLVNRDRLRRILSRMLDENEFLSPYGIRALSRYHAEHPFVVSVRGDEYRVNYLPAEFGQRYVRRQFQLAWPDLDAGERVADSRPAAVLLYYGDTFKVECPTRSGNWMNLFEVSRDCQSADPHFPP